MSKTHIAVSKSKFQQDHVAYIAPSEPMTNIVQQGTRLHPFCNVIKRLMGNWINK